MTQAAAVRPKVRPAVRWLFVISTALSALALWWPAPANRVSAPAKRDQTAVLAAARPVAESTADGLSTPLHPLPTALPLVSLGAALFDPFVGPVATPVALKAASAPTPVPTVQAPTQPAAPVAAPSSYRFLGQMVDPSGQKLFYLARADQSVPVQVGARLDDGYVVEVIDASGIKLHHPATESRALIPMPAPPDNTAVR